MYNQEYVIGQLDGNETILSDINQNSVSESTTREMLIMPTVASYNLRSLIPKINNFKDDILERGIDCAFLSEIWENSESEKHQYELEKLFQLHGLQYFSSTRPKNKKGVSYGGTAVVVNLKNFTCERLPLKTPSNLEIVWCLLRPRVKTTKFKRIIACSFYSPPSKGKNSVLFDYIITTLHSLYAKYPESAIFLGGDRNQMNIQPLLNCGLKLKQMVCQKTRGNSILDIIVMNTGSLYHNAIIAPPINPDDPKSGVPSDHFVPICIPHTDRYSRPPRNDRIIRYRPLPESAIKNFGQWIVKENWQAVDSKLSPSEQVTAFENLVNTKLDELCPIKVLKLSNMDKPFITTHLKSLKRQRVREYRKNGKSPKYHALAKKFNEGFKTEAKKYLDKNVTALKESKPGKAFSALKRLGAQLGDCVDEVNTFTLPCHDDQNFSSKKSAEVIASHFAAISQEFPPLKVESLPVRVKNCLAHPGAPPEITDYQVYKKILAAKKPKAGVPSDLPKIITQEFAVELTEPVRKIINSIIVTGEWPEQWKMEYITPLAKIPQPQTEDDLRPISLTAFFSKVTEHFVVSWLMEYIKDKIDMRQYGGIKGSSITHYLIEFINFILMKQDDNKKTAVLTCMIDFSKAFNRQNHHILVTKLCDMGVPGWLLRIIIGFLSDRKMLVRYKGESSSVKTLPGGGPQGTLLGLLLFLVLINDAGFESSRSNLKSLNELHLKYVDDFTLAESIDLTSQLKKDENATLPTSYHERTGHILPTENSKVYSQLTKTKEYAYLNDMKINEKKSKLMVFNPCSSMDFLPQFKIGNDELQVVEQLKLLGVCINTDLKWHTNTETMIRKANSKLWIIRRLKNLGAKQEDLIDVYCKQIRCHLEFAAPVWQGAITQAERADIERVQRCAFRIILGDEYDCYDNALRVLGLEDLEKRRVKLCLNFALKAAKNEKYQHWFQRKFKTVNTRSKSKFCAVNAKHARFERSPISYLTQLLNHYYET